MTDAGRWLSALRVVAEKQINLKRIPTGETLAKAVRTKESMVASQQSTVDELLEVLSQ